MIGLLLLAVAVAGDVTLVVASRELPAGEPIDAADLTTVHWPEQSVPDGAVRDPEQAVGSRPLERILAHEVVRQERLAWLRTTPVPIPDGHRVVEVLGPAGFGVGHDVDVWRVGDSACRLARARVAWDEPRLGLVVPWTDVQGVLQAVATATLEIRAADDRATREWCR